MFCHFLQTTVTIEHKMHYKRLTAVLLCWLSFPPVCISSLRYCTGGLIWPLALSLSMRSVLKSLTSLCRLLRPASVSWWRAAMELYPRLLFLVRSTLTFVLIGISVFGCIHSFSCQLCCRHHLPHHFLPGWPTLTSSVSADASGNFSLSFYPTNDGSLQLNPLTHGSHTRTHTHLNLISKHHTTKLSFIVLPVILLPHTVTPPPLLHHHHLQSQAKVLKQTHK